MVKTYEDARRLISGLWRKYNPTEEERALFRDRLSGLKRMDWLVQAISDHRAEDKSGRVQPDLPSIISRYKKIATAGDRKERQPSGRRWRAGWAEMRNGIRYLFASGQTFGAAYEALEYCRLALEPAAFPVGEVPQEPTDVERDAVMADYRVMLASLLSLGDREFEEAKAKAVSLDVATAESVVGNPMAWKRFTVGCVWAVAERMGLCK